MFKSCNLAASCFANEKQIGISHGMVRVIVNQYELDKQLKRHTHSKYKHK